MAIWTERFTTRKKRINLRDIMTKKIEPISSGYYSYLNGEVIHNCFGATIFVGHNHLSIMDEDGDIYKTKKELEKVLGLSLIKSRQYQN